MKNFRALTISLLTLCSISCGEPASFDLSTISENPSASAPPKEGIKSINYLRSLYRGGTHTVVEHCVIEGWISANDRYGEFSQMIIIDDGSAAIPVHIEGTRLFADFPIGERVSLICSDLVFISSGGDYGTLELCAGLSDNEELIPITRDKASEHIQSAEQVGTLPINQISTSAFDETMISRSYILRSVIFPDAAAGAMLLERDSENNSRMVSTRRNLEFEDGTSIEIYLPSTLEYGDMPLPDTRIDIQVCVERYMNKYSVRATNMSFKAAE